MAAPERMMAQIMHAPHLASQRRVLGESLAPAQEGAAPHTSADDPRAQLEAERLRWVAATAAERSQLLARLDEQEQRLTAACAQVQAQLDLERSTAFAAARQAGHAEGLAAGQAEAAQACEGALARLEALAEVFSGQREQALAEMRGRCVEVVSAALCRLLGERMAGAEGVLAHVERALEQVRSAGPVEVHVASADLVLLAQIPGPSRPGLSWVADGALSPGDCRLRTPSGDLEALLSEQLAELQACLVAAREAL